jgi:hypothetical protein
METVLLVLLMGAMNLLAFVLGARIARKADRGEEIKLPSINPMEAYKEHREQSEANKEQERLNTMLENINNYDGTGMGQKDIL